MNVELRGGVLNGSTVELPERVFTLEKAAVDEAGCCILVYSASGETSEFGLPIFDLVERRDGWGG